MIERVIQPDRRVQQVLSFDGRLCDLETTAEIATILILLKLIVGFLRISAQTNRRDLA